MAESIKVTEHAVKRYQQRIDKTATFQDVVTALRSGLPRTMPPADVGLCSPADLWIVSGRAVFPVARGDEGDLIAMTCLKRQRPCKADRRLMREQAFEDDHPELAA